MLYVFESFWAWLLAAFVIGLIVGWLTWSSERRNGWFAGWAKWGAIAFVVGLVIALLKLFPGRFGLWLETALLSFIVYIAGCFLGGWLKHIFAAKAVAEQPAIAAATPPPAPRLPDEDKHEGSRPPGYASARGGVPDDLKLISGIGHQNEGRLHGIGIWHFDQIAGWTPDNVKWAASYLAFPGRIEREKWIEQAKQLAAGVKTEFSKRAEAGLVKTSRDDGSLGQGNVEKTRPHE
jgi:predicted flap endonuclease-1-like 5' DNA nuclease